MKKADQTAVIGFGPEGEKRWVGRIAMNPESSLLEDLANARLIAAAPSLLSAAKFAAESIDHSGCKDNVCPRCDLDSAIDAAEGGL